MLPSALLGQAAAVRLKVRRGPHIEIEGDLVDQLSELGGAVPPEEVLVDEAQPVDLQPAAGLLEHLAAHRILGALPKLDPAADGIAVFHLIVRHHEDPAVFLNDRAHPDVHEAVRHGHGDILSHKP